MTEKRPLEKRIDEIEARFPILEGNAATSMRAHVGRPKQQTLSMARTMILRPKIVMLDEPSLRPRAQDRPGDLRHHQDDGEKASRS